MIVGIGVELVDLARFERAAERYGARLRERVFTEGERAHAPRAESLGARFAAKVAARRALGLAAIRWRDVEVVREPGRAPELRVHGAARRRAQALGVRRAALSLSHDRAGCIGHVVLEDA